jgi:hypothetical protein
MVSVQRVQEVLNLRSEADSENFEVIQTVKLLQIIVCSPRWKWWGILSSHAEGIFSSTLAAEEDS